ncbi:MAG TPA: ATP-binding protein [Conexibacter sp.]|jgi:ATP-dependent DNA helicase RecG|nr:ATP-binding protein [Conexibacter sp.]
MREIADLITAMRAEGDDGATVEAKRASTGWPEMAETLSAFANTPGGGAILFGLDEAEGFATSGVYDAAACRKALATTCRSALDPPIVHRSGVETLDGAEIVWAEIAEADASLKPVRVKATGKAYLRAHDGDFQLSGPEEQAFIASRTTPRFDAAEVPRATRADLDDELVASYVETARASSSSLARFDDEQILFRTGVLTGSDRWPSLAGLLALGLHPQQYMPNLVIQAHVVAGPDDPPGTRAVDPRRFDGPIPRILADALAWVRRNTGSRVVFGEDGHGRDELQYPAEAVRELVANALVHRDLGEHALRQPITIRIEPDRLIVSNPGGLYGITRDRLGQEGVTSARNSVLIRICQYVRLQGEQRVCEALASGIPTVMRALVRARMTPPAFFDQGIRFTVSVPNHALLGSDDLAWLTSLGRHAYELSDVQRHALVLLRRGRALTNRAFRDEFPMDSRDARRALGGLVDRGLADADEDRGGRIYRLGASLGRDAATNARQERKAHTGAVLTQLRQGERTVYEIVAATGLTQRQIGYALQKLREAGEVEIASGGQGRRTTYRVTSL